MKNDFTPVFEAEKDIFVDSLSSLDVDEYSNFEFDGTNDTYFYAELYDKNGKLLARNTELGTKPKYFKFLKPQIKVEAQRIYGGVLLAFSSDVLAKNVELSFKSFDIVLSDNYFDLVNDKPYKVFAKTDCSTEELLSEISILSVYDIPLKY